jgi:hypothetical protein
MNTSGQSLPTRPAPKYQMCDTFRLSQEGLTHHFTGKGLGRFAEEYANMIFVVEQWYDHDIAQKSNNDPHGHPLFSELTAQSGGCLYEINSPYSLLGPFVIESHMVLVPRPIPKFKKGDTFLVTEAEFGEEYAGKLFVVQEWYDHYLPEKLIKQGYDHPHGTPYYDVDGSACSVCLYDTTFPETSLYEWDMEFVPPSERHLYEYTQLSLF